MILYKGRLFLKSEIVFTYTQLSHVYLFYPWLIKPTPYPDQLTLILYYNLQLLCDKNLICVIILTARDIILVIPVMHLAVPLPWLWYRLCFFCLVVVFILCIKILMNWIGRDCFLLYAPCPYCLPVLFFYIVCISLSSSDTTT